MTRVSKKSAWEYCIYVGDNDYGLYQYLTSYHSTNYQSMPYGMSVTKTPGPAGIIKIKIAKSLLSNASVLRFTISTFNPSAPSNTDSLYQGGSSAVDVFPGTLESFGGEIPGYGQIKTTGTGAGIAGAVVEYTKYYIYDGINPIVEYAPNGSILARYIYAGGLHIAKIAGADTNWYHCDALGSPRKMTDESGTVTWTNAYYPFGEMIVGSGDVHGFTGKELDETGLNYFCLRYYDTQIGRFITLDPFGGYIELPQTQNRYAYCINNPLKYIDPLGLIPPEELLWLDEGLITWTFYDDIWIGVITLPPLEGSDPGRFSDWLSEGLGGSADEGGYSDPWGGDYGGGYLGGSRGGNIRHPYGSPGRGDAPPGGGKRNITVGLQFQAQATFLWWGMSWGQTYVISPVEQRGWYFFMEPNRGLGLGISLGPIVAWGNGLITGDMADISGGYGWGLFSYFENGLMQAIFFGFGWGIPITFSSGLMITEKMDELKWP